MTNYTPGATRHIPKNLLETAHEDTGKWMNRDDLEAWVFRRFAQLEAERDSQQRVAIKAMEERDEWKAQAEGETIVAGIYRDERFEATDDALSAHVERLESIINSSDLTDSPHVMSALNSLPETSLARLIAEKQSKAFDELAGDLALNADNARENGYMEAADVMQDAADYALTKAEMRRQAGGDT